MRTAILPTSVPTAAVSLEEALAGFEKEYVARPDDYALVERVINLLVKYAREDLLRPWAERAFLIDSTRWQSSYFLALTEELTGSYHRAAALWRDAVQHSPGIDPYGLALARCALGAGDIDDGLAITERALAQLAPVHPFTSPSWTRSIYTNLMHIVRSELLLRVGDVRGFAHQLAQTGVRCPSYMIPGIPLASAENLANKHVLVTGAAGYGDQVLFASVIPLLLRFGCRITLAVHPDLRALLAASLPACRVIATPIATAIYQGPSPALQALVAEDPPDMQATVYHLPLLRTALLPAGDLPFRPYLHVPEGSRSEIAADRARLLDAAAGRTIVGVTWDRLQRHYPELCGATEACRTGRTSLPVSHLTRIADDPHIAEHFHFVALHERSGLRAWPDGVHANLSCPEIPPGDFGYTAALIELCDRVISVDMSVANVAAMLGKQTWLMLAHEGDWRWGHGTERSPWITNARIFRQPEPGAWQPVVDSVKAALLAPAAGSA